MTTAERLQGLTERERLLEILYMVSCELRNSKNKSQVNDHLKQLFKVCDAIECMDAPEPIDS